MEFASAIRFGGMLVSASECNYEHYLNRGLLCPHCKDAVFLRSASDRTRGEKSYSVKAHFCHFPSKAAYLVAECELRVNALSQQDIQRLAAQAKGQRIKLLQKWFWTVIQKHPKLNDFDKNLELGNSLIEARRQVQSLMSKFLATRDKAIKRCPDLVHQLENFDKAGKPEKEKLWLDDISSFFHGYQNGLKEFLDVLFSDFAEVKAGKSFTEFTFSKYLTATGMEPEDALDLVDKLVDVDFRMQKVIAKEVLEFLATKRNMPMLQDLLVVEGICKETPEDACKNLATTIATTFWADEFEQLEQQGNSKLQEAA